MLLECLLVLCRVHERPLTPSEALQGLPVTDGDLTPSVFPRAAKRAGLSTRIVQTPLRGLNPHLFPAILLLKNNRACVITKLDADNQEAGVIWPELPDTEQTIALEKLEELYSNYTIYARPEFRYSDHGTGIRHESKGHWFWQVIADNRKLYRDVVLAGVAINLFALAMPLFVMNVYDRVVPNHATETLWVLSVGVLVVLIADMILRVMRAWFVDLGSKPGRRQAFITHHGTPDATGPQAPARFCWLFCK